MQLKKTAVAGTMESGDIMITIEPKDAGGVDLDLSSNVMQQYGRQIEAVIRETLSGLGIENAAVQAVPASVPPPSVRQRAVTTSGRCVSNGEALYQGPPAPVHDVCPRQ